MRKRVISISCVVLVLILLVCILPFPQRINKTLSGLRWQADNSVCSDTELSIKGWYFRYLVRDSKNRFEGTMTRDGHEIDIKLLPLHDITGMDSKYGVGIIYDPDTNRMASIGPVYVLGAFDKVFIEDDAGLLSFPAETRDEALSLADEIGLNDYS